MTCDSRPYWLSCTFQRQDFTDFHHFAAILRWIWNWNDGRLLRARISPCRVRPSAGIWDQYYPAKAVSLVRLSTCAYLRSAVANWLNVCAFDQNFNQRWALMIQSRCAMQWERTQFHSTFCDSESMSFASDRSGPQTRWSFWALNQKPWPQLAIPYMVNFAIFASHPSKYYSSLQYKLIYMLQYTK